MTLNSKLIALSILLSVSCTPKEREYNNPADPNSVIEKTSGNVPSPSDKAGPNGSTTPCLTLLGCNTTPGTSFNFANAFETTPAGCTNVLKSESLAIGGILRHFVLANCGARHSIYTFTTSYTGIDATSPVNITSDCNTGSKGVVDFTVDHGTTASLVVYTCYIDSTTYNSSIVPVQDSGTIGTRQFVENVYGGYAGNFYKSKIRFNPIATAFGLACNGFFRRFTQAGASIGGAITITSNQVNSLELQGSSWLLLSVYSNDSNGGLCSKISDAGTLTCNGIQVGGSTIIEGRPDRVLNNYYDGRLYSYILSNASCATSSDGQVGAISNNKNGASFNAVAISETHAVVLYQSNKNIIAAVFNPTDSMVIESEAAVSEFTTSQNSGLIKAINNRIYVSFDKDGRGYVAYSNESI